MPSLAEFWADALRIIEDDLRAVLESPPGSPPLFYRMLHYHMGWVDEEGNPFASGGGKRIRPGLCLMVAAAAGGRRDSARPAAAAVELIHNFSLLHDDIQDQSPMRRRRPSVWSIWGNEQAINAGDAMFALAHLAIPRLAPPDMTGDLLAQFLTVIDDTSLELTRGQHLDISFEKRTTVSTMEYLDMIQGKTAALIGATAELGAISAGVDAAVQSHYREFGRNLGMAFQIMDDILDIWGEPELTGKQAASDIYQRKKTLPVLFGLEKDEEIRKLYTESGEFDERKVERIIHRLDSVGARHYAEEQAQYYSGQTVQHLEAAHPSSDMRQTILELVEQLLHRES